MDEKRQRALVYTIVLLASRRIEIYTYILILIVEF